MRTRDVDDARLLDGWDRAVTLPRPWRELAVLESASGTPMADLSRLSIGERDRQLLQLRIALFGPQMECETSCPACGTRLELPVDARTLLVDAPTHDANAFVVHEGTTHVRFRLPDSIDVAACLQGGADPGTAAMTLARRCVQMCDGEAEGGDGAPYSDDLLMRVADRMASLDAQADLVFSLTCIDCAHVWEAPFDPAAALLADVEAYMARLTGDVHQLARAYGWAEASILAMGASRRQRYLALVQQ